MTDTGPRAATADPPGRLEAPLAEIEDLSVTFDRRTVVDGISLRLSPGRATALVGESGSGKSVTARTLLGLGGPRARTSASVLRFRGDDLTRYREPQWRRLRGAGIGYVLQDALVSLDPLRPVGAEIADPLRAHRVGDRAGRHRRVLELLERVGVPEPELRARQLPSELSGGLRQRALIAAAIALDPPLLVADEPTTALDSRVAAQILELLAEAKRDGIGLLLISHDLAVVERVADDVVVMEGGRIVESGPVEQVLRSPAHDYTRALLDAVPSAHPKGSRLSRRAPARVPLPPRDVSRPEPGTPLLVATDLHKRFRGPDGVDRTVVDGVSFTARAGRTLGIVGESGSGKSTTAAIALGLTEPDGGTVTLAGEPWSAVPERDRRARRRRIAVVDQDALSSFDPRRLVGDLIDGALRDRTTSRAERRHRIGALLDAVGLPAATAGRHPSTLSGGQRQRVALARAIAGGPELLVLDEPVSALDVSVQAQVLDLLDDLQRELGTGYLFISHDLGVVHHVSDEVLVMHRGRAVEHGAASSVLTSPSHPYTVELVGALPTLGTTGSTA